LKIKIEKVSTLQELNRISKKYKLKSRNNCNYPPVILDLTTYPVSPVPEAAFEGITHLEVVICPSYLKSVENNAFHCCQALKLFDAKLVSVGNSAFGYCTNLLSFNFENMVVIGDQAFQYTHLYEANLVSAEIIGKEAFQNCFFLSQAVFPEAVYIGPGAFGNTNIKKIVLPITLEKIDQAAFYHILGLKVVISKRFIPPEITPTTFKDTPPCPLYVISEESAQLYRQHPYWRNFKNIRVIDYDTANILSL
jgi:hypothetical protein